MMYTYNLTLAFPPVCWLNQIHPSSLDWTGGTSSPFIEDKSVRANIYTTWDVD